MICDNLNKREKRILNEIELLQNKYSITFPEQFVKYHVNEKFSDLTNKPFYIEDVSFDVDYFYPILSDESLTLEKILEYDREDGFISENMIAIARDEGGDRYYWDSISQNIYYVRCEDVDHPRVIAENINAFFNLIGF